MRIAIANPDLVHPRGAQRQVVRLASEWQRMGHDVSIFVGEKAKPYAFDDAIGDVPVVESGAWHQPVRFGGTVLGRHAIRARRRIKRLADQINAFRPDVVNAHNHPAQWLAGMVQAPVVWTCNEPPIWHYYPKHQGQDRVQEAIDKRYVRHVKRILVLDEHMRSVTQRAYSRSPVEVVGSGCELPGPLPDIKRDPRDFRVLNVVGVLNRQKRALDAALAVSAVPNAHLVTIGAPGEEAQAIHTVMRSGRFNNHRWTWHEKVSDAELLEHYATADAAIFVPENQPWGIFPLECILAGVPVVLSDDVGCLDVLEGYPFVAPTGDWEWAARVLERICLDRNGAREAIRPFADRLRAEHSWRRVAERTLAAMGVA